MESLDVRMVDLPPMNVASALGFGQEPEEQALGKLLAWAGEQGLLAGPERPRLFGFNNPGPSAGSPNYGYEVWLTVGPEVEAGDGITVKQFGGGLYAVTHCGPITDPGQQIPAMWQQMEAWLDASPYRLAPHQWLEEHLNYGHAADAAFELDLYMPVSK